jgi:hypothetical protein
VSTIPESVVRFREAYRAKEVGPSYSGWGHFLFTSLGALAAISVVIFRLRHVHGVEWATIPIAFLFANLGEYLGHRGAMHRPRSGLQILYRRHTQQHHHFYTHESMAAESSRDFKMVLFPPAMLLFFLGGLATPIGMLLYLLLSANAGLLFAGVTISYFLCYEWLHLCYHLPESSWVSRLPFMRVLRRHHTLHHDLALMGKWNFNITFPIGDWLLGTYYHVPASPRPL